MWLKVSLSIAAQQPMDSNHCMRVLRCTRNKVNFSTEKKWNYQRPQCTRSKREKTHFHSWWIPTTKTIRYIRDWFIAKEQTSKAYNFVVSGAVSAFYYSSINERAMRTFEHWIGNINKMGENDWLLSYGLTFRIIFRLRCQFTIDRPTPFTGIVFNFCACATAALQFISIWARSKCLGVLCRSVCVLVNTYETNLQQDFQPDKNSNISR